jgi:hypothetical protein
MKVLTGFLLFLCLIPVSSQDLYVDSLWKAGQNNRLDFKEYQSIYGVVNIDKN